MDDFECAAAILQFWSSPGNILHLALRPLYPFKREKTCFWCASDSKKVWQGRVLKLKKKNPLESGMTGMDSAPYGRQWSRMEASKYYSFCQPLEDCVTVTNPSIAWFAGDGGWSSQDGKVRWMEILCWQFSPDPHSWQDALLVPCVYVLGPSVPVHPPHPKKDCLCSCIFSMSLSSL